MQLWDEQQLHDALCEAGFEPGDIQRFWQRYMFVGLMAVKSKGRGNGRIDGATTFVPTSSR